MKLSSFRLAVIIFAILAAAGSYAIGRTGFDTGRAIVDSRCSAGAFIAHAQTTSEPAADGPSSQTSTPAVPANQVFNTVYAPVPAAPANLIAHPDGWRTDVYGHNDGHFSTVAGYSSRTALRTDITSFSDGTATWSTPNLAVTPGSYYQYQDYYRSDVPTAAVLVLIDTSGQAQYVKLDFSAASDQWAVYTQRFFVPTNVTQIRLSHALDRAGWLETDAHTLQGITAPPLSEALVSLTFDDGWSSIHDHALPLLTKYGMVSTQYLVSGYLGSKSYMSPKQVYDFKDHGHEIASHTVSHPDLTKTGDKELMRQLQLSYDGLTKCFGPATDFAAPYGTADARTIAAEKGIYDTARSTDTGYNSLDTLDPYHLKVQNMYVSTPPEQVRAWLTTASVNHIWLIIVYHQVDDSGSEFSRHPADFEADLANIKASGMAIKTIHDAYAAVQNQRPHN